MASPGNSNQPAPPFDINKFFKSPNPSPPNPPNLASPPYPPAPSASYPPPAGAAFSYPAPTAPYHNQYHMAYIPDPHHHQRPMSYPTPPSIPPGGSPSPGNPNAGARLMALLSAPPSSNPDSTPPPPQPEFSLPTNAPVLHLATVPTVPVRMPSNKLPRGRHLAGDHAVYDVDVRLQGEVQPQLEVTPITKYGSDPQLVLGRQIAVNKTYICYGLKQGNIRVLNINTALRSLLRGHTQRVTDMAFFADDVHLLASVSIDGRVYVWKISEGPEEEEKPQITGSVITAIQIVGEGESVHPRVCWHCHKQEVLVVGIGKCVLRIDTTKVGKGKVLSAEEPLKCPVDKLIDGVQFVGEHDGEVTDLSMCQWMTTRLVSASVDGTIKIWEDRKAQPLVVLRPHDGQPINSVSFLTSPHRPDHIILITAGPLNREVKIWASAGEEGWLLPSDADSWNCTQTLELRSSVQPKVEEAFFNQVVALSQAGLILLANAKKNAIYVMHLDYGYNPAETRMDYIAEFTVTMPILSFTGTSDISPQGEQIIQVYCVQTQAIQQYALDLSLCLPPPLENIGLEKLDPNVPHNISGAEGNATTARHPIRSYLEAATSLEVTPSNMEYNPMALTPASSDADIVCVASPPLPLSPRLTRKASDLKSPANSFQPHPPCSGHSGDQPGTDGSVHRHLSDVPLMDDSIRNHEKKVAQDDISSAVNPSIMFKHPTHLITPSEILMAASSSETSNVKEGKSDGEVNTQDAVVNNDGGNVEVEVKVVGESAQHAESFLEGEPQNLASENKERVFCSQTSDLGIEMARECCAISPESYNIEETRQVDGAGVTELVAQLHAGEEEVHDSTNDTSGKALELATSSAALQSSALSGKGKKQKGKISQVSGPSSPSRSNINSTDSSIEHGGVSNLPSAEAAFTQVGSMQEMLNQMMTMQKELQKQMTMMVAVPVTKEGRRLEAALGRSMEKAVKANNDALWARFQEESAKNEKLTRDRTHQITSLISNFMNKDLPAILDKTVKKEIAAVGQAIVRTTTPIIEKTITTAVAESFQRGVGDKAVNQLEKSVNSKLEATVARQIQAQFQTSGKQALQDSLKCSFEASVIPAFEMSCKTMFEQVDATFQKGMAEHTTAAQQYFESAHSPLALTLRDAVTSVSSLTQTLSGELADGQRKLLALAAAGANSTAVHPLVTQLSNGPLSNLHDKVEPPFDPTKELSRLISEGKFVEAFTGALQRSDVTIVSWLCGQVNLRELVSMVPQPLSQGVLLSLLQQLACDISNDTSRKLGWMTDVAAAINPADPIIAVHVRPIFEQVYQILSHQRSVPTVTGAELSNIRLLMHVINSMIMTCK